MLEELREHGPTAAEIDKARDRHQWSVEAMRDDPEALAEFFGHAAMHGGPDTPEARHEAIASTTREAVHAAAGRVFRRDGLAAVAVGALPRAEERRLAKALDRF